MRSEQIGEYEIEFSGVHLPDSDAWAAHLAIYGPSPNPMHRNPVLPEQRVSPEASFPTELEAEEAARRTGLEMIAHTTGHG
jgi:hypothetical protein